MNGAAEPHPSASLRDREPSLVAVRLPAGGRWLDTVEQVWAAGDAVVPLPVDEPDTVVRDTLAAVRPSALIDEAGRHELAGGVPVAPGTAAVVITSGSTGAPKGAVLSWAALEASARSSLTRLGATGDDRWLACLPLHHIAGLQVVVRSRMLGRPPVVLERFSVDGVAGARDATMVALVPTMLRRLLDAGVDLSHLRLVLLGGAAPGPRLLDDAAADGIHVVTTYGMTETCGGCVYDGVPLDGVAVELDTDEHIRISGPVLFSGYRLRDDDTGAVLRDDWLTTADLGRITDGRLEVLGRADDVIITGGEKVPAEWLAGLLEQHPDVAEAAVTGRADPEWGQRVVAYVVPRPSRSPTLASLRAFIAERAPAFAAPREVVVVDELPRLPSGKIDRLRL